MNIERLAIAAAVMLAMLALDAWLARRAQAASDAKFSDAVMREAVRQDHQPRRSGK